MIADGVHSLSDLITDIIVIIFVGVSVKEIDSDHPYGHGKFETFATLLISISLFIVGLGIFWSGINKIIQTFNGVQISEPSIIAFYIAILSIISKELLFWYTKTVGDKTNSPAVIANAWHHRSDAFSSIGSALGISGAIFLGKQWRILDPLAGMVVSIFILNFSWKTGLACSQELLESSLPLATEKTIAAIIMNTQGAISFHNLKSRKIGGTIAIDTHVLVNKDLTVETSHLIASQIENNLKNKFGPASIINIHIEPYYSK